MVALVVTEAGRWISTGLAVQLLGEGVLSLATLHLFVITIILQQVYSLFSLLPLSMAG